MRHSIYEARKYLHLLRQRLTSTVVVINSCSICVLGYSFFLLRGHSTIQVSTLFSVAGIVLVVMSRYRIVLAQGDRRCSQHLHGYRCRIGYLSTAYYRSSINQLYLRLF